MKKVLFAALMMFSSVGGGFNVQMHYTAKL